MRGAISSSSNVVGLLSSPATCMCLEFVVTCKAVCFASYLANGRKILDVAIFCFWQSFIPYSWLRCWPVQKDKWLVKDQTDSFKRNLVKEILRGQVNFICRIERSKPLPNTLFLYALNITSVKWMLIYSRLIETPILLIKVRLVVILYHLPDLPRSHKVEERGWGWIGGFVFRSFFFV